MTFSAADIFPDAPAPASTARLPARRVNSVRRTLSLDGRFPTGRGGELLIDARGRDFLTPQSLADAVSLNEDRLLARISAERIIQAVDAEPAIDGLNNLIGRSSLRGLRAAISAVPDIDSLAKRPMRVLLDDLVGMSIIADAVWLHWPSNGHLPGPPPRDQQPPVGTCVGFRAGSSAHQALYAPEEAVYVPHLDMGNDPSAFHPVLPDDGPGLRRIRRIDVWTGRDIHIDAMFQDSVFLPDGRRAGVHEYALRALVDAKTLRLSAIAATPVLLPHRECFDAPTSVHALIGTPLAELRETVLMQLRGVAGCTHLNDAARALSEAAGLIEMLPAASS